MNTKGSCDSNFMAGDKVTHASTSKLSEVLIHDKRLGRSAKNISGGGWGKRLKTCFSGGGGANAQKT